jgi:hypothetical protein
MEAMYFHNESSAWGTFVGKQKDRNLLQQVEAVKLFYESSQFETIVGEQMQVVSLLQNIFKRAGNMSEHKDGNPFINFITSGKIWCFADGQYWKKLLEQETEALVTYKRWLREAQHIHSIMYTVMSVVIAIVLVVGMASNGLLLTIFIRHKEMRTVANSMLINLTVVDLLSLVVNVLLEYLRAIVRWKFGLLSCKLFFFSGYLLVAVSTYSVAMLSVQRFVAINQLPSLAWCHQSHKNKYVLIGTVWGIGCILSVPHAVIAEVDSKTEICDEVLFEYPRPMVTADLIVFRAVPLLITVVFSGLTAYRIRRSVREIPGEATGQQQLQHSRMVSSTVLIALTFLFVVSYAPFFLFHFLIEVVGISMTNWKYALVDEVTYHLRFVNCCLNPIVLFVMSKRYRRYIRKYCGQGEAQPAVRV